MRIITIDFLTKITLERNLNLLHLHLYITQLQVHLAIRTCKTDPAFTFLFILHYVSYSYHQNSKIMRIRIYKIEVKIVVHCISIKDHGSPFFEGENVVPKFIFVIFFCYLPTKNV